MNYRVIDKDEINLLREASEFELSFPTWFKDAVNAFSTGPADVFKFYQSCSSLYGLFRESEFVGLVYFERISADVIEVHLDLKRGVKPRETLKPIADIRDREFRNGARLCHAWVLKRNKSIQRVLGAIGFRFSGLNMKDGSSHGKVLSWTQMLIVRPSMNKKKSNTTSSIKPNVPDNYGYMTPPINARKHRALIDMSNQPVAADPSHSASLCVDGKRTGPQLFDPFGAYTTPDVREKSFRSGKLKLLAERDKAMREGELDRQNIMFARKMGVAGLRQPQLVYRPAAIQAAQARRTQRPDRADSGKQSYPASPAVAAAPQQ
jgi:hypothetical protein